MSGRKGRFWTHSGDIWSVRTRTGVIGGIPHSCTLTKSTKVPPHPDFYIPLMGNAPVVQHCRCGTSLLQKKNRTSRQKNTFIFLHDKIREAGFQIAGFNNIQTQQQKASLHPDYLCAAGRILVGAMHKSLRRASNGVVASFSGVVSHLCRPRRLGTGFLFSSSAFCRFFWFVCSFVFFPAYFFFAWRFVPQLCRSYIPSSLFAFFRSCSCCVFLLLPKLASLQPMWLILCYAMMQC